MNEISINIKHKIDRTLNNKWVEYAPYIIIRNGHMFVDSYSAEGQRPTRFELIDEGNPWYGVYFTWNGVYHPRRKVSSIEEPIDMISVSGLEEYPFDVDGFCVSFQPSCIITSDNNGLKVRYEGALGLNEKRERPKIVLSFFLQQMTQGIPWVFSLWVV